MTDGLPVWHTFRIRFKTAQTFPICPEADEFLVSEDDREVVWIRSVDGGALGQTEWLTLRGSQYPSHAAALEAGERWRDVMERAFAALHVPADFGERSAFSSWINPEIFQGRPEFEGVRVMNDVHGLLAFPVGERVFFFGGTGSGYAGKSVGMLRTAVESPLNRANHDQQRLAFDLYSHGMLAVAPDARFVLLMMAVEALMLPFDRSERVQRAIAELRAVVRDLDLDAAERDLLVSHVGQAKRASLRQRGERLARTLGDRRYGNMAPEEFFAHCYKVRGRVVHADPNRPSQQEVTQLGGQLSRFVGDLIAGPELIDEVSATAARERS